MYDDELGIPTFDDEDDTLVNEDAQDFYDLMGEHDDSIDYERDDEDEF